MKNVLFAKKSAVAYITLNQPDKMNGLSEEMVKDLLSAFDLAERDEKIRAIVLTGKSKVFCAGGDISVFDRDVPGGYKYIQCTIEVFRRMEKIFKPIIAAVNGFALGGGCELAIASDIVIASENAIFGLPEVTIGIMPGFAVLRLHQIVGRTKAKELILTGKRIDAREAEKIGLVNQVVPAEQLMDAVVEETKILVSNAPFSLGLSKSIINRECGGEEITTTANTGALFFGLRDLTEGKMSFFEKRKPKFEGR